MRRLNFRNEPWDEVHDELRTRVRWFGHPFGADMLGAPCTSFLPGAPGGPLHMHYGVEEMFFVLAGTPAVRTPEGEERLVPGDVVYFPEGPQRTAHFLESHGGTGTTAHHIPGDSLSGNPGKPAHARQDARRLPGVRS